MLVERVEDGVRPDEDVPEDRRADADDRDIAELGARAEPFRHRQRLEDGRPDERPTREEARVLECVHRRVVQRGLVQERDVPEREVDRPERERDERVEEPPQGMDKSQQRS